ncbi:hypothetical protein ACFYW8_04920 [Streptomyces sp. NPDC002742]
MISLAFARTPEEGPLVLGEGRPAHTAGDFTHPQTRLLSPYAPYGSGGAR